MSSEHKSFVFDYEQFELYIKRKLEISLETNETQYLEDFIMNNLDYLRDPYKGEFLPSGWMEMLENKDVHEYGDFALTKFYDPSEDIGLGYRWTEIQNILTNEIKSSLPILGFPIGKSNNYFDPGKIGSYFQDFNLVIENREVISNLVRQKPEYSDILEPVIVMFSHTTTFRKGLYISF